MRSVLDDTLDHLDPPFSEMVKPGDRVLVKVNMGCSGARDPAMRLTSHPAVVEAIIEAALDCGAHVCFGDDVVRCGRHGDAIYRATGMKTVAGHTGAKLVDFIAVGAREIRSGLLYPASYLVTNAYFDADVVINAANCRSGPVLVGMSAAIKNMFGCVIGKRKELIHKLFGHDPRRFGRAIADIYRSIPATLSLLDMTTVLEGFGVLPAVRPVGFLLASVDPVALDAVAAKLIGYDGVPVWTTCFASEFGLGCNDVNRIRFRGIRWPEICENRLRYPLIEPVAKDSGWRRVTRILNATVFRPRPSIDATLCTGCGECAQRCPVGGISRGRNGVYAIDLRRSADCGCCLKVCQSGAARLEFAGMTAALRRLAGRLEIAQSADLRL